MFLIHHDPDRIDEDVGEILQKARRVFRNAEIAKEGSVYEFEGDRLRESV